MGNLVKTVEMRVLADAGDAQAKLDDLDAKAKDIDGNAIKMRFRLDDGDGKAQLDDIKAKADELGYKDVSIKVRVDGAGRSIAELEAVKEAAKEAAKVADSSGGGGGILSTLLGGLSSAGSALPLIGGLGPAAIPVLAAGVAVLLPEVVALGSGFAAAGAGAGAFALLALPAIKKVEAALTDTPAQLKKLSLSSDEAGAVAGIKKLEAEFGKLSTAFQPQAFNVFNGALKVANSLLPTLAPMASAFATAIGGLLKQLNGFTQSTGFKQWIGQFTSLIGPAVTAIGHGIGEVAVAFGKLLTSFSGKDVGHAINIAFGAVAGVITVIRGAILGLKAAWDTLSQDPAFRRIVSEFQTAWTQISATGKKKPDFSGLVTAIKDAVSTGIAWLNGKLTPLINSALHTASAWLTANASSILVPVGKAIMQGLIQGMEAQLPNLLSLAARIAVDIAEHKGPIEKDRVLLVPHGQAIMQGLMYGIGSEVPALRSQLAGITGTISKTVGTGHGGGGNIEVHFNGLVTSPQDTARQVVQVLKEYKRNGGNAALGIA